MGCLISLIMLMFLPFILIFYIFWFIIQVFWEIIKFIVGTWGDFSANSSTYSDGKSYNSNKKKSKVKNVSYKEMKFDKEADLWGLSEEDRRIAKEERMSPADFVEAEERDDDELGTDEWEDE